MVTELLTPQERELDRVLAWRKERLLALGVIEHRADKLAPTDVDLHELERLIAGGCPPEIAVRILEP
jgi:hypothetical protein